jgi:hypothetical protein
MSDTAKLLDLYTFARKGVAMNAEKKDVATLIELLKMEAERWPQVETHEVSQSELFCRDRSLLEMWPEACRRTGVGRREFPHGVIKLWKKRLGGAN